MLGNKEFTGIVIEDDLLKVARVRQERGGLSLVKLDRFNLVESLERRPREVTTPTFDDTDFESEGDSDSIFGLEEGAETTQGPGEEISFDDLDTEESGGDLFSLDMTEEAGGPSQSNEVVLFNLLSSIDSKKVRIGLNISAGNTVFQIIRDTNFNEVKKKDLIEDLEGKLESIYGTPKSSDNYAYEVRDNGSLILASVDEEPALLGLVDRTRDLYSGKIFIEEILPDEVILVGLINANYELPDNQITGVIQFEPKRCRIVFMNGDEIWLVSPIINEGTDNKGFLNTVFSKILFQLDTGEVPSLDKLILANNSLGNEAVEFFRKNFPDISVEEFTFDPDKFSFEDQDPRSARAFTTAIGMAWATSGFDKDKFPSLSLIPSYVADRQKIFKLQWHGVILLLLIGLSPITFNYFYQQNVQQIQNLESELNRTNTQIADITPTVNSANKLTSDLSGLREKLVLLDTLSRGTQEWSTKLAVLNQGMDDIRGTWITGFEFSQQGIMLSGYSLYRNQIPRIVDIFHDATLLSVNIDEQREQEIYQFSILIKAFVRDRSRYSPPTPEDLKTILGN